MVGVRAEPELVIYEVMMQDPGGGNETWDTTKYMTAKSRATFEEVQNQQFERKHEGQKTSKKYVK